MGPDYFVLNLIETFVHNTNSNAFKFSLIGYFLILIQLRCFGCVFYVFKVNQVSVL